MSNNLAYQPRGISAQGLRVWGLLFIVLGTAGQSIIQNALLGVNSGDTDALLQSLDSTDNFAIAAVALVLQFVMACAVPIFSFLLVEGFRHTSSLKKYFLRVAGVALLSELPYNLAMSGNVLDLNSRNPVFGLILGLVMLYIFRYYAGKSFRNIVIKAVVILVAVLWVDMLRIQDGAAVVVMVAVLWALRKKRSWQVLGGCVAMFLCTAFSILYIASPITFLMVHFYNGEPGEGNRVVNYLAYPALLLAIGLVAIFAF